MKNGKYIMVKAPKDYPGFKYRGKYCYEHHLVLWQTKGYICKPDECTHHINGDFHDNRPENIEVKKWKEHSSYHTRKRGKTMVVLKCPYCEQVFTRERRKTHLIYKTKATFCSRPCAGKFWAHELNEEQKERLINNVIKIYKLMPM